MFAELLQRPPRKPFPAHGPVTVLGRALAAQSGAEEPVRGPHALVRRRPEEAPEEERKEARPAPELGLDPLLCQLAVNQSIGCFVQSNPSTAIAPAALPLREDLQNLLMGLARRTAWGGDRRKGSARIELSEGALAGATLVVHAEQRCVSVELELPIGVAEQGWQQRIARRLEGRGFAAHVKVGGGGR